ncbi:MAG TPA: S-layer homology domain-containing protein [Chloroflexia bacterium]|nr:S-layer homology domain-containing protein [Chloroflexia bacterium]
MDSKKVITRAHTERRMYAWLVPAILFVLAATVTWISLQRASASEKSRPGNEGQPEYIQGANIQPDVPESCVGWSVVSSPNPSSTFNVLRSVTAIAPNDVWAVGNYSAPNGDGRSLIEHWDGTTWVAVPGPDVGSGSSYLFGVDATAPNDVWAVGNLFASGNQTFIIHWDGSQWTIVPSPSPGTYTRQLSAVTALAPDDAWAVGYYQDIADNVRRTLTLHWDGTSWSVVPSPSVGPADNELLGVEAVASDDAWAVGYGGNNPLILHWDGTSWSAVPTPALTEVRLYSVTAISSDDVWAVGTYSSLGITLHWNGSTWTRVDSPNVGQSTHLYGVAAVSANDVWAVGSYAGSSTGYDGTLAMHWNGTLWKIAPTEAIGSNDADLYSAAALPGNEVWAVGSYHPTFAVESTLIEHYTGPCATATATSTATNTPTRTPSPTVTRSVPDDERWDGRFVTLGTNGRVRAIAVSGTDVYVGGDFTMVGGISVGHIARWDGTAWHTLGSGPTNGVSGVTVRAIAISGTDVYVGGSFDSAGGLATPYIARWDGSQWHALPNGPDNVVYALSASGSDLYAGGVFTSVGSTTAYYIARWDGSQWSSLGTGATNGLQNVPYAIAVSGSDVYVGGAFTYAGNVPARNIARWDGTQWNLLGEWTNNGTNDRVFDIKLDGTDVYVGGDFTSAAGVSANSIARWDGSQWYPLGSGITGATPPGSVSGLAINGQDVFAGGYFTTAGGVSASNIAKWDGSQWHTLGTGVNDYIDDVAVWRSGEAVDVYVGGNFTGAGGQLSYYIGLWHEQSPGPTPTPPPSPTPCTPGSFSDVPPDSTFYQFVTCLVSREIISGYSDCTFRPGNEITRGQIAKMVSNAAAIEEDPGPQVFEDVDSTNPFYTWVNRLANVGYMGGYPCGGPGEPCGSNNLPYFRPFANATRGQLSKIVSNAGGIGGTPTGQFFADVPEDNPFYTWIMRLTELGVMSGYPCGSPNEPCDGENRPYFRPYNNVTRGQASKIVANTFFPNCLRP